MSTTLHPDASWSAWTRDKLLLGLPLREYLRTLKTPFNAVAALILCVGLPITWIRFTQGIAATTNLNNDYPWGLWIGFDVLCGVALAAGGFCMASAVHLFKLKQYYTLMRPAILTGFLGYFFVVVGLCFDLGRPWRLPYPMFVSYGVTSVMFLVGWHVALYLTVQFLEFCPAIFEWLGWKRVRHWVLKLTIGATVFGVILSTLHQSALGALFLLAPTKVHPLWYSSFIPVLFFTSAIAAGLSMVIVESMLSHRVFHRQVQHEDPQQVDQVMVGLSRSAAVVLFTYFCLKWIALAHEDRWAWLFTSYGAWYLVEVIGFVLGPCIAYFVAAKVNSARIARVAAVWTVLGIVLNRLNVSIFTFNWQMPYRYVPSWMEFAVTITIVTAGLLTFRFMVNRMPVLYVHPEYPVEE
ncbi:MAG: polysulfide reductase NrfD [Candidatus Hydrogenedentes bacterium]|nr:polysulfide reductase NrfD [Candidatus Hydrogenedentota bacterium]